MKKFRSKHYHISTDKIKGKSVVKFAVLSDLHGIVFGNDNEDLLRSIAEEKPDAILIAGDMVCSSNVESLTPAEEFLAKLPDQCPVLYALGNHEYRMLQEPLSSMEYTRYERTLTNAGICFLHNEHVCLRIRDNDFVFYGLEIPLEYYRKPVAPHLGIRDVDGLLGHPAREGVRVLLAHNPVYGRTYFSWGADFIFSGHNHGGVIRFSENRGLISPQFHLLPSFCCGHFQRGKKHMIVSAGLGEHTVPVRIHNPRELVFVELTSADNG